MASEVEERIVAAKFDSSDFEKGVDKTVKKLDELKEKLDFKKVDESMQKFGNKATEAMDSTNKSLTTLTERFTTFTGMLKQKFLSGLADQVVGVFFKLEHAVGNFFKSMTTDQMGVGLSKYEQALTSVRMITQATYEEVDANGKKTGNKLKYTEDEAYKSVEAVQRYADETSYSTDQMVDAMSKMVAAGVKLEDAEKNVQGIANACAVAGVNATDAARAFFNLSQAYSAGKLTYGDYRSLQLLNMTNENFEEALLQAGVKAGTLVKKKGKDGKSTYKTKRTKGSKVTAGKTVSRKDLALNTGWATTDVMDALFSGSYYLDVGTDFAAAKEYAKEHNGGIYDPELAKEYLKSLKTKNKLTKEEERIYSDLAIDSFMAAREARNFGDAVRAVGEYVSSKWSTVFEHLFGRLEDAAKFFTKLSEGGVASFFYNIADWIEAVAASFDKNGTGPEQFQEMILALDTALGNLLNIFYLLMPAAEDLGDTLWYMTADMTTFFEELDYSIKEFSAWLTKGSMADGSNRLDIFKETLLNVTSVFNFAKRVIGLAISTIARAFKLFAPVLDGVLVMFNELSKPFAELGENTDTIEKLQYAIDKIFNTLKPIMDKIKEPMLTVFRIIGQIGAFFLSGSIQAIIFNVELIADAIGLLFEIISGTAGDDWKNKEGVIGGIAYEIESLKNACTEALKAVGDFFGALFDDIRDLFGLKVGDEGDGVNKGSPFSRVKNFFETNEFIKNAEAWFEQAKKDITDWFTNLPARITEFINGLLYEEKVVVTDEPTTVGGGRGNKGGKIDAGNTTTKMVATPLKDWLDSVKASIENFFTIDLPAWFEQTKKDVTNWFTNLPTTLSALIDSLFYEEGVVDVETTSGKNNKVFVKGRVETPLKKWLNTIKTSVENFFTVDLPAWFQQTKTDIINWFTNLPTTLSELINGLFYEEGVIDVETTSGKNNKTLVKGKVATPLKKRLDEIKLSIENFFKVDVPAWFEQAKKDVIKWVTNLPKSIAELIDSLFYEEGVADVETRSGKNNKVFVKGRVETPLKKQLNGIVDIIKDLGKRLLKEIETFVINLPENIKTIIKAAGSIGRTIVGIIKGLFDGDEIAKESQEELEAGVKGISIEGVLKAIADIGLEIANQFISLFTGEDDMEKNFEWVREKIDGFIKSLPGLIDKALDWTLSQLGTLWESLYDAVIGTDKDGNTFDSRVKNVLDKYTDKDGNLTLGFEGIVELVQATFGDAIKIAESLWGSLTDAITGRNKKPLTSDMYAQLESVTNKEELERKIKEFQDLGYYVPGESGIEKFVREIGASISEAFKQLPGTIVDALTNAIDGIDTAMQWFIGNIDASLEAPAKEATETVENTDPEKSELSKKLEELGIKLRDMIFGTLPKFIAKGFELVKTKGETEWWPKVTEMFDGLIEGINTNPEFIGKVEAAGDAIVQWINDLPEKIRETLSNAKHQLRVWLKLEDPTEEFPAEIENNLDTAAKETEKAAEKTTLLGTISNITTEIGTALSTAFGEIWSDITTGFSNLPTYIVTGLNLAFEKLDGLVGQVTDFFQKGLAGENAEQLASEAEANAQKLAEESVESTAEGAEKAINGENPLVTAIKGLGSTIWNLITKTIPESIKSGFDWVKANWDKEGGWKDKILGLFTGLGINFEDIDISEIAASIRSAFENLPGKIQEAWTDFKTEFPKTLEKWGIDVTSMFGNKNDAKSDAKDAVTDQLDQAADGIEAATKETTLFDTLTSIGQDIGGVISAGIKWAVDNIGPMLVDGFKNALNFLGSILTGLGQWFVNDDKDLGDALAEQVVIDPNDKGLGAKIKESLNQIGKTIETLIKTTIPTFITNGLVWLFTEGIPNLFNVAMNDGTKLLNEKVADRLEKTGEEVNDKANIGEIVLRNILDIANLFKQFLDIFTDDTTGRINTLGRVVIGITLGFVVLNMFSHLWERFKGNSEETAETAKYKNNAMAGLKFIIVFMETLAVLSLVAAFIKEDQFERMKYVLDIMQNILEKLQPIMLAFAALSGVEGVLGGITDLISIFKKTPEVASAASSASSSASKAAKTSGSWMDSILTILEGIATGGKTAAVSGGIAAGGLMISEAVNQFIDGLTENISLFGVRLSGFADKINKSFGDLETSIKPINNAIEYMGKVVELVGLAIDMQDQIGDVYTAINAIDDLALSFGLLANPFNQDMHITEFIQGLKDLMNMTSTIETFVNWTNESTVFDEFKYAIASLASVLSFSDFAKFAGVTTVTEDEIHDAVKILKTILEDQDMQNLMHLMSTNGIFDTGSAEALSGTLEKIMLFGNSLARLAEGVSGFTRDKTESLSAFFAAINKLAGDKANSTENAAELSKGLIALAGGLRDFLTNVSSITINESNIDTGLETLSRIGAIAQALNTIIDGGLVSLFASGLSLEKFGAELALLGPYIQTFMESMKPFGENKTFADTWNFENVTQALYVVEKIALAAYRIKDVNISKLNDLFDMNDGKNGAKLIDNVVKFVQQISTEVDTYLKDDKGLRLSVNPQDVMSILTTFSTLTQALGQLPTGVGQLQSILDVLSQDMYINSSKAALAPDFREHGLVALAANIITMYEEITKYISGTKRLNDNGDVRIKLNEVEQFFSIISGFFNSISPFAHADQFGFAKDYFSSYMTDMVGAFEYLSDNIEKIFKMIDAMAGYDDTEKLEKAQKVMDLLKTTTDMFRNFIRYDVSGALVTGQNSFANAKDYYSIVDTTSSVYDGMLQLLGMNFDDLTVVMNRFASAIDAGLDDPQNQESFKSSGKSMAQYLYAGIQEAFDTDTSLQLRITPVLDATQVKTDMAALFGVQYNDKFNLGTALSEAVSKAFIANELNQPKDYSTTLADIKAGVDAINTNINAVNSQDSYLVKAFSGITLYVDSEELSTALAPEMDKALAPFADNYERHASNP